MASLPPLAAVLAEAVSGAVAAQDAVRAVLEAALEALAAAIADAHALSHQALRAHVPGILETYTSLDRRKCADCGRRALLGAACVRHVRRVEGAAAQGSRRERKVSTETATAAHFTRTYAPPRTCIEAAGGAGAARGAAATAVLRALV